FSERVVRKRDAGQHENLPELTFGSDDEQQVNSVGILRIPLKQLMPIFSAVRVKRVSRAGSSHRPRVMNKNKGNSHAHQSKAVEKKVDTFD
uniref:Movement protein n=1 Tax=Angiostrongylus cantonensis TaxID=6313 RepID=A0A0K0DR38_ANGCA